MPILITFQSSFLYSKYKLKQKLKVKIPQMSFYIIKQIDKFTTGKFALI